MLTSMTGFGKASANYAGKKITIEIKSLNSKQFDLSVKAPSLYREKELALRSELANKLSRGKVDLNIHVDSGEIEKRITINQSLALAYLEEIENLKKAAPSGLDGNVLTTLLNLPDVMKSERSELQEEEWAAVNSLVNEATDKLMTFRTDEGARLAKDIAERVELIESLRKQVSELLPIRLANVRERIERHIADYIKEDQGEKNRLEQEIVYYLEKLDITEEHIRLEGHCVYFLETMKAEGMVGKKLGFISQEIGREINTMGAKANQVDIQKLVVQMKDELEKIKEQLLNIC